MKYPGSFLSPLLAQEKLRFSGNNGDQSTQQCRRGLHSLRHNNELPGLGIA